MLLVFPYLLTKFAQFEYEYEYWVEYDLHFVLFSDKANLRCLRNLVSGVTACRYYFCIFRIIVQGS